MGVRLPLVQQFHVSPCRPSAERQITRPISGRMKAKAGASSRSEPPSPCSVDATKTEDISLAQSPRYRRAEDGVGGHREIRVCRGDVAHPEDVPGLVRSDGADVVQVRATAGRRVREVVVGGVEPDVGFTKVVLDSRGGPGPPAGRGDYTALEVAGCPTCSSRHGTCTRNCC